MGSLFRVDIFYTNLVDFFEKCSDNFHVYGAVLEGQDSKTVNVKPNSLLIIGNESHGISDALTQFIDTKITIKKFSKIGGGVNHRFALDDMIMIKDNHIDFCGGISQAIKRTKQYLKDHDLNLDIVVETRNLDEIKEVIKEGGITRILLDNFDCKQTQQAVNFINNRFETC